MNSKNESNMAEVIGQQILPTWLNFTSQFQYFEEGEIFFKGLIVVLV